MPVSKTIVESFVEPDEFRDVILDVERYPEFLDEVKRVEIVERGDNTLKATFWVEVNVGGMEIKSSYTLNYTIEDDTIHWTLDSSPDLTKNEGYWRLEESDGETLAHYEAEILTSLPIPEEMQKMFADQELPAMMEKFRDRAESI
jgi:ribosome-associated toxin RatA of RatAB toxin-antitoxin module